MYTIGIDLGGTNIAAGIVNQENKIICKGTTPTFSHRKNEEIVADMARLSYTLLRRAGLSLANISSVGIAAPGTVLPKEGVVERAENLGFDFFPIVEVLRKDLPIERIYLENDANAAAFAEAICGAARGSAISVMITLGTGLGGGIIINNKIYTGFNGGAGELGHHVIARGGRLCGCGRRGCWETYCSATGLIRSTKEMLARCEKNRQRTAMEERVRHYGRVNARVAFDAMKSGDIYAKRVVDEYKDYLAEGIIDLINIFQPEVISIGGGICNERGHLLSDDLLIKIDRAQFSCNAAKKTVVRLAELGNDAGIIGAALLEKNFEA